MFQLEFAPASTSLEPLSPSAILALPYENCISQSPPPVNVHLLLLMYRAIMGQPLIPGELQVEADKYFPYAFRDASALLSRMRFVHPRPLFPRSSIRLSADVEWDMPSVAISAEARPLPHTTSICIDPFIFIYVRLERPPSGRYGPGSRRRAPLE